MIYVCVWSDNKTDYKNGEDKLNMIRHEHVLNWTEIARYGHCM